MVSPVMLRSGDDASMRDAASSSNARMAFPRALAWAGDDDAHLGHLAAAVRSGFVMDDHDVVDEQHAGANGAPGAAGEIFGPGDGLGPQLERVEVDTAEPQYRRAQLVATRNRAPARPCPGRPGCGRCRGRSRAAVRDGRRAPRGSCAGRPAARIAPGSHGRSTGSRVPPSSGSVLRREFPDVSCVIVNHVCMLRNTFDIIE